VFVLSLFYASCVTSAAPVANEVMLVNTKTNKCLTIKGGESDANSLEAVQFNCDSDPSRRWRLNEISSNVYQIRNVKTNKCLTIKGGESPANSLEAVQFNCDNDPSRRWTIRLKLQ